MTFVIMSPHKIGCLSIQACKISTEKPDPTNQGETLHLMVSKPVVVSLFGIAHFYDLVVVKVQGLGIELPVGNRDTF